MHVPDINNWLCVNTGTSNPRMAGAERIKKTRCRISRRGIWSRSTTISQSAWSTSSLSMRRQWPIATPRSPTGNYIHSFCLFECIPESEHPGRVLKHYIRCPHPFHCAVWSILFGSFEIQVVPEYQRRGIGAYLISLLETIGKATQMEKVMLTVFKGNME